MLWDDLRISLLLYLSLTYQSILPPFVWLSRLQLAVVDGIQTQNLHDQVGGTSGREEAENMLAAAIRVGGPRVYEKAWGR